jgi:hypothetical protein
VRVGSSFASSTFILSVKKGYDFMRLLRYGITRLYTKRLKTTIGCQ